MPEKHVVDTFGPVELLSEMRGLFGTRRMVELIGWCVLIGATVKDGEGTPQVIDRLMSMGFSRAAAYRATADIKRLARRLEEKRGLTMSMSKVLAEINAVDTSLMGDFVVQLDG